MKIGILTQPLHNNYGGLLQAYALQCFLAKQGHDVFTIDFSKISKPRFGGIKGIVKNSVKKYVLKHDIKSVLPLKEEEKRKISQHTNRFISENIRRTQSITNLGEFSFLEPYNFDAFIVGSDQVWRPSYSPGMPAFFLDFLLDDKKTKRIAYAASFGVDHCDEYTKDELTSYSCLAKLFDAIGVREDSAIELCDKYFGVKATHVLDPTFLLDKDDYVTLINKDKTQPINGNLMVYILDPQEEKSKIIKKIEKSYNLTSYNFMENNTLGIYQPVTQWLRGFMDSEFVVTDSFHGVVFSIIFNKPFIAIGNSSRGLTRFISLLKLFNLESQLISSVDELRKASKKIDMDAVKKIKKNNKDISTEFLLSCLNGTTSNV
ncbi:polysaccharide pyruvyl transferase family protein [Providencia stuartii]|uniref:polysaccharide pyruvyl transferase family protein n=1 Tax=Providencia stuartii TaxID=588 RepID=UPI0024B0CF58|nr:polysaccharide pyruvyl transferase family protein [Providencia stuartii]